jgi:hypothetical protein
MERVRAALAHDENVEPLRPALDREATRLTRLMFEAQPAPPPDPVPRAQPLTPAQPLAYTQPAQPAHAPPDAHLAQPAPPEPLLQARSWQEVLRGPRDVDRVAELLRAELAAGRQVRVTIEIGDDGGKG